MSLVTYKAKRDFTRTREPAGLRRARSVRRAQLSFVIQKHAATRLHYDFRLEIGGALKSWAVPKGIPTPKGDKRLAVEVEDHPLEYGRFEGNIPPGNYGAGTVMVWDSGTYEAPEGDPLAAWEAGKLVFRLHGKKLKGLWTLVRMRPKEETHQKTWLLIKSEADARQISARADDTSAKSGRTMQQIAAITGKIWESNRKTSTQSKTARSGIAMNQRGGGGGGAGGPAARWAPQDAGSTLRFMESGTQKPPDLTDLPKSTPRFVEPMKARLQVELPRTDDWLFEVKLDGIRAVGIKEKEGVRLFSRRPRELTQDYPEIINALARLPAKTFVVDGEIVALDAEGRSSFQLLQNAKRARQRGDTIFYLFDLLHLNGHDVTSAPLTERRAALQKLLAKAALPLRFCASLDAAPDKVWRQIIKLGLEGVIAKRRDSKYEPGRRSGAWLKIKAQNEQEFVIGGYTAPGGSRQYFGSVLVGYYAGKKLIFASKVGTGFDARALRSLYQTFQKLRTPACPFANLPTRRAGQYGQGITAAEMKRCFWLKPKLVCQVKFLEWTRDGNLRQPVFLGLREDKKPREVIREKPLPLPSGPN